MNNTSTLKFSVATGNVGLPQYLFLWGNSQGLNLEGKRVFVEVAAKQKELGGAEGRKYGADFVKKHLLDGTWTQWSSSPQREHSIAETLKALFLTRPNTIVGFQEVSNESMKNMLPENAHIGGTSMFDLVLKNETPELAKLVTRGNATMYTKNDNITQLAFFPVEYHRSVDGKDQVRRASFSVLEIKTDPTSLNSEDQREKAIVCVGSRFWILVRRIHPCCSQRQR